LLCQCTLRWQRRRCLLAWKRWVGNTRSQSTTLLFCARLVMSLNSSHNARGLLRLALSKWSSMTGEANRQAKTRAMRLWQRANTQTQREEEQTTHHLQLAAVVHTARETTSKLQSYMRAWSSWTSFMRGQLIAGALLARCLHYTQTRHQVCAFLRWRNTCGV
jgi:glycine/D-amino acid oxidase-like deaminating enzyme